VRPTVHDPGHVALRRGIRTAIALPVVVGLALYAFDDVAGAIFAAFGAVGLLVMADFAGTAPARLLSYLLTGAVGSVALAVGWAASFSTVAALLVTMLVVFVLSFLNLLRGRVAVGTPAILVPYVVAVSLPDAPSRLPAYLLGWWLAVVVSTVTALVVLPRNHLSDMRGSLAGAFSAIARATRRTWLEEQAGADEFDDFAAAVAHLDAQYGGQPFRLSGLASRDQALTLLVDQLNSAHLLLSNPERSVRPDAIPLPARTDLARALVTALEGLAAAMADPRSLPSGAELDGARVRLTGAMEQWVVAESAAGADMADVSHRIGADHQLRMAALVVEQMVEVARIANGGAVEELERRPPVPVLSRISILGAQLHPRSPWFRNSVRSSVGLGLAVLVVNLTGVQHGFWVLLGVFSILRLDAVGTRSVAAKALAGTVVGVIVSTLLVVTVGQSDLVLWILLTVSVFLAVWSGPAIGFVTSQAFYSAMLMFVLAVIDWPTRSGAAVVRVEDVFLGAAVAVVVGVLIWPRGAAGYLRHELAGAVRYATEYIGEAITACTSPVADEELERLRNRAVRVSQRAAETYDVALMQRGPTEDMRPWTTATSATFLLISAGRIIAHFASTTPQLHAHPELVDPIGAARSSLRQHWTQVATRLDGDDPYIEPLEDDPHGRYPVLERVGDTQDARALIIAIWVIDWVWHINRLATSPSPEDPVLA
jgi:uncharacterized membrane protein YccC